LLAQRKGSRSLAVSLLVRLRQTILCCSQRADVLGSREVHTPLRGAPPKRIFPLFAVLLGCVKWHLKQKNISIKITMIKING
jgi:hypothetical protein